MTSSSVKFAGLEEIQEEQPLQEKLKQQHGDSESRVEAQGPGKEGDEADEAREEEAANVAFLASQQY